jgi:apolipoprotein N-acyltransferase
MTRVRRLAPLPLWLALVLSAAAGLIGVTAFAPLSIWVSAFISLFLLWWCLDRRSFWTGLLVGLVYGLTLWAPLINWLTVYLGPIPWLALAVTEALYIAIASGLIALIFGFSRSRGMKTRWLHIITPAAVAALWVAHEWLAANWPWGGFSWARFGMAQYEGLFAHSLSWIGSAGLSFVIAWTCAAIYYFLSRRIAPRRTLLIPIVVVVACALVPLYPTRYQGSIAIAGVQGNTKSGLFDAVSPGDNLTAHLDTTLEQVDRPVDLIVWPENAADIDPTENFIAASQLSFLAAKFSAPVLTGAITSPSNGTYFNSSLLWSADGLVAQYDKAHPVPFAEWMPARSLFHSIVPDLVDLVTRDYSFGTRSNVIDVGTTRVGVSICFDIVDDALVHQMITHDAQVIVAQTNNADFGDTAESAQQLEIARVRAIESGRYVVNVSTVGITALIAPTGQIEQSVKRFEQAVVYSEEIPLAASRTLGTAANFIVDLLCTVLGLGFVALAIAHRSRQYRVARANKPVVRRG